MSITRFLSRFTPRAAEDTSHRQRDFLALVNHEIRTPLNVILGIAESNLQNEALTPEIRASFEKIYHSGDMLLHVVNDMLDSSKAADKPDVNHVQHAAEHHEEHIPPVSSSKIIREPMPYGSVLIVDDMESNLDVARLLLQPYGLRIETAVSGFEAIARIKAGAVYDIIFMDHMMPEMDGMETAKKIRDMGYTRPIIALTANAFTGQSELFLANGFDEFISKPMDMRQLNNSLNKLIRDRQPPEVIEAARAKR